VNNWVSTITNRHWSLTTLVSASSTSLVVWQTQLSTVSDRAFPVASVEQSPIMSPSLSTFHSRLKSHLFSSLISISDNFSLFLTCSVHVQWLTCLFGHCITLHHQCLTENGYQNATIVWLQYLLVVIVHRCQIILTLVGTPDQRPCRKSTQSGALSQWSWW